MELFYSPLACSLASRIALHEAAIDVQFTEVCPHTKRLPDGRDYREVYTLGLVPALRTDSGSLLTENIAVLMYITSMSPALEVSRAQHFELLRWLGFINTELHKGMFNPQFAAQTPEAVRAHALAHGRSRLTYVDEYMRGRATMLDRFSVADAYLYTVLTWMSATPVALSEYPALHAYFRNLRQRPSVARAFSEELPRYRAQLAANDRGG